MKKLNYITTQKDFYSKVEKIYFDINKLPVKEYKGYYYFLIGNKLYRTNVHGFENRIKGGFHKKSKKPERLRQLLKVTRGELTN